MKAVIALQAPFYGLKRAWPLVGGGVHPGMAKVIIDDLGKDIVLCAGGGIHAHPSGPQAGAAALRQALDAVMAGRSLEEAAKEFKELKTAVDTWGIE